MKTILNYLKRIIRLAGDPFEKEWPMILIFTLFGAPYSPQTFLGTPANQGIEAVTISFAVGYFFAALVTITKSRAIKLLSYVLVISLALVNIIGIKMWGIGISPIMVMLVSQTNQAEAMEFFDAYFSIGKGIGIVAGILLFAFAIYLVERNKDKINARVAKLAKPIRYGVATVISIILLIGTATFGYALSYHSFDDINELKDEKYLKHPTLPSLWIEVLFTTAYQRLSAKEIGVWEKINMGILEEEGLNESSNCDNDSLNIVLVIGESYRAKNSQLYGYEKETTPFQLQAQKDGKLVAFKDINSISKRTSDEMRSIFSLSNYSNGELWSRSVCFPMIFKKAGWDVYMFDNQNVHDMAEWTISSAEFLYSPVMKDSCYAYYSKESSQYDLDFLNKEWENVKVKSAGRNLFIYHLMGQHIDSRLRFPDTPENNRFTVSDYRDRNEEWMTDKGRQQLADYDNSTRYNDKVFEAIVNKHNDSKSIIIYLSDHGDEIYDSRPLYGRYPLKDADLTSYKEVLFHVPMMIYLSDNYKVGHIDVYDKMLSCEGVSGTSDFLGHMILGLSGIKTKYYKSQYDILSGSYQAQKRLLMESFSYDD